MAIFRSFSIFRNYAFSMTALGKSGPCGAAMAQFKGSGFKTALVRRDVSMKLLSHFMKLDLQHHNLKWQVWARGSKVITAGYRSQSESKSGMLVMPNRVKRIYIQLNF